jgi:V/A-type H+-transporting ATPase subunit E
VQNGRTQAEQIVSDAQAKAEATVKQAQEQAKQVVSKAREEADNLKRAGREALELAFRDTVLALRTQLMQRFTGEVRRLVGGEQEKQELLEKMILEIASRVREEVDRSQQVEVLLPRKVAGLEELSRNPEELEQGILTQFVRLTAQDMLRQGVSFGVAKDNQGGLKVRLVDREVVLDLSDRAVADAILEHLQPRFRGLLEGVVK